MKKFVPITSKTDDGSLRDGQGMCADRYAEVVRIADDLIGRIAQNDIPCSYPNLAERIAALMRRVVSLEPTMAPHTREVTQAGRRYYSATLWRQEPGGHAVLYSTMKKNLEAIRGKAERGAKVDEGGVRSETLPS
jgi:hypothetical protein